MLFVNRAFAKWLVMDNLLFWLGVALPMTLVATVIWYWWASELSIRIAGYALSLLGAISVFRSVIRAQRTTNAAPLIIRVRDHLLAGARAAGGPRPVTMVAAAAGRSYAVGHVGLVTVAGWRNLHDRVQVLESKLTQAADAIVAERKEREEVIASLRNEAAAHNAAHDTHIRELSRRMDDISTGDWMVQMAGVTWIIIGQACTTFPSEISRLLPIGWLSVFRA
jgi:hypothetical protein